ncbi:MAG: GWxTD domain-containing protein [Bacteroidota bacterium]
MKSIRRGGQGRVWWFVLTAAIGFQSSFAQVENQRRSFESISSVFFDAIVVASDKPGKSRLDMYVQVPHSEIRFTKEEEQYVGRYELSMTIRTPQQDPVWDRSMTVTVQLKDFAQTTSDRLYSLQQISTDLDPGTYDIVLQVHDEDSKKTSHAKRSILVTEFKKDSLSLSDVMLVNRVTTDGDKKTIVPNISGNVGNRAEGFYLFFEVYHPEGVDSVHLSYKILNQKQEEVAEKNQTEVATGLKTQIFAKVQTAGLSVGGYLVIIKASATPKNAPAGLFASTTRIFSVRWADLPFSILDLDKAVEQMRYIARESETEYIQAATTVEEKKARFLEFWRKRDPDTDSKRNELMEEYYDRVDYANKTFSHYIEGWRTDMGMVYIRMGPPENVERHPFEVGTRPYEVWYYYQLNREFIFVDDSGFGDYRLKYPTTDLWGRIR